MNYNKKTIMDVDVAGKKILLRCDFNVPQDKATGAITIANPSGDTPICTFCSSSEGSTSSTFFFFFPAIFSTIQ